MQSRIDASTRLCRAMIPAESKPSWSSTGALGSTLGLAWEGDPEDDVASLPPHAARTSAAPSAASASSGRVPAPRPARASPRVRGPVGAGWVIVWLLRVFEV